LFRTTLLKDRQRDCPITVRIAGPELDDMNQAIGKTDVDLFGEESGRKHVEDEQVNEFRRIDRRLIESRQLENGQVNWTLRPNALRNTNGRDISIGRNHK